MTAISNHPLRKVSTAALAHPLPAGMRDVLPEEAHALAQLGARVMASFAQHGYQRVEVPAFEYADVLEQGLGALKPHEAVRFVEPETAEVVALRPDMTLQVARLVSTRLQAAPSPARLCYQGSVVRLRHERSRRHKQFYQAGIELVGAPGPAGDIEVLEVATAALRASGLEDFVLDLGHARIAGSLLALAPESSRPGLVEALGLKDQCVLAERARKAGLSGAVLRAIVELPSLHGDPSVLARARPLLAETPAAAALEEVAQVCTLVTAYELAPRLVIDLGEVWNFAYYTGIMFQLLAEGPGEPVGSGGRYDGLFERFGVPRPAAGFGMDLGHLAWARRSLGRHEPAARRVLIAGEGERQRAVARELRQAGLSAALAGHADPLGYARAWCYSHVLRIGEHELTVEEVTATEAQSVSARALDLASLIAELTRTAAERG